MKYEKKEIIIYFLLMSLINIGIVKADSIKFEVTDISLVDSSGTILVEEPVKQNNVVSTNIIFNEN